MTQAARMSPAPQHLQALERANAVRLARAALKRAIACGEVSAADVILDAPWEAESMTVADLLTSQRRWGQTRCRRFLQTIPLSESKTIGSMTDRQRQRGGRAAGGRSPGAESPRARAGARRRGGLRRDGALRARRPPGSGRRADLEDVPVGVAQVDRGQPAAVEDLGRRHLARAQPVAPRGDLRRPSRRQRQVMRGAGPLRSRRPSAGTRGTR